jgi:hypothetical protein
LSELDAVSIQHSAISGQPVVQSIKVTGSTAFLSSHPADA